MAACCIQGIILRGNGVSLQKLRCGKRDLRGEALFKGGSLQKIVQCFIGGRTVLGGVGVVIQSIQPDDVPGVGASGKAGDAPAVDADLQQHPVKQGSIALADGGTFTQGFKGGVSVEERIFGFIFYTLFDELIDPQGLFEVGKTIQVQLLQYPVNGHFHPGLLQGGGVV